MSAGPLRIAILTYSTKARGGVVHSLHLAESLQELGHEVEVFALGKDAGDEFFRPVAVPFRLAPVQALAEPELDARIEHYIDAYTESLAQVDLAGFDACHAQDCVSANALWRLRKTGIGLRLVRTVHHVDEFTSPYLSQCQENSIYRPDLRVVVSAFWQRRLASDFGVASEVIFNGVDLSRFHPPSPAERRAARDRLGLNEEWAVLNIGGVEPRKNTIRLLRSFERLVPELEQRGRSSCLLLAGGETLLDHAPYKREFERCLRSSPLATGKKVRLLGPVDDGTIETLYHASDAFVFPSTIEGWGLVVLEAMASGLPVLASDIPVFREYLTPGDNAVLVDPASSTAIAAAMLQLAEQPSLCRRLIEAGLATANGFTWRRCAEAHERLYRRFLIDEPPILRAALRPVEP